jgi:LacI family transcriptional regulator
MSEQIAIVMSEVFLRRLTPALMPFVRREQDFRIVSIHRPINELLDLLRELNPRGLITEWLPEVTEGMLKLDLPTVIADTDYTYPGVVSIDVDDRAVGAAAAEAFSASRVSQFRLLGQWLALFRPTYRRFFTGGRFPRISAYGDGF